MRRLSLLLSLATLLPGCMALAPGPNEPTSAPPLSSVTEPIMPAPVAPGPPPEISTPRDHPVAEPVTNVPPTPPPPAASPRGEERETPAARPAADSDDRPARRDRGKGKRHHKAKKHR